MILTPHTYPYAIDDNGKPIYINQVTQENRRHTHYHCYGCGKELFPVLCTKKESHFRHEKGAFCDPDRYLHEYAKATLKARFEESDTFEVQYNAKRRCANIATCEFAKQYAFEECEPEGMYRIDLKKYYDTCTEEQGYYKVLPDGKKKYIADLILTNSNDEDIPPVCIEVWVTHECTDDKKKNGGHIIEVKIENEEDANRPLIESLYSKPIRFYNFKRNITLQPSRHFLHVKTIDGRINKETSICSDGLQYDENAKDELIISDERMSIQSQDRLYINYLGLKGINIPQADTCCYGTIVENKKTKSLGLRCWSYTKFRQCPCQYYSPSEKKCQTYLETVYTETPFWCNEKLNFKKIIKRRKKNVVTDEILQEVYDALYNNNKK